MVLFLCIVLRNLPYKPHHIENMSKGLETELWMAATTIISITVTAGNLFNVTFVMNESTFLPTLLSVQGDHISL